MAGILVAGLSLFTINSRVRKFFAAGAAIVSIGIITVAGFVTTWLARGENAQGLTTLTGRTNFWALVLNQPRTRFQEIFGFGLSNASINGLPIDSNWLAVLHAGRALRGGRLRHDPGVAVRGRLLPATWRTARARPVPPDVLPAGLIHRGTFTDASTYLLHLTVAASLMAPLTRRDDFTPRGRTEPRRPSISCDQERGDRFNPRCLVAR